MTIIPLYYLFNNKFELFYLEKLYKLTNNFFLALLIIEQLVYIECLTSGGFISFELITGYVLSAPADSMVMQPGTLQLTDCLNVCRQNSSCLAINFETGLCVLLQESADKNPQALQKSQFPVFTIYAHKICLQGKFKIIQSRV